MMNKYEFAHRAERVMSSIPCWPTLHHDSCDGATDFPHTCAAHGGDRRDEDWWTLEHEAALAEWERRWKAEVMEP